MGSGEDLDLQTLKVVDQVSGKQLGVRADMTSQAVRIDAHSLVTDEVQRLCYAGPVVFANPQIALSSRVPYKAGAEIFGAAGLAVDAEVIELMLAVMAQADIRQPVLLLGHMGIYRGLVAELLATGGLAEADEPDLFRHLQRKSAADIRGLLARVSDPSAAAVRAAEMVAALPTIIGGLDVLDVADKTFADAPAVVTVALANLRALAERVAADHPEVSVRVDVSELSGYGYHNGPVFAVYHPEHGSSLARGGRYDGVGEAFGRPRPATGFDVDLKSLLAIEEGADIVFAALPHDARDIASQRSAIAALRAAGERVQCGLSADERAPAACKRKLSLVDGEWRVQAVDEE